MHIVCLCQHYRNPDCAATTRHYTFLKHWSQRHRVTLITTDAWHRRRLTHDFAWVPDSVALHSLAIPYENRMPAWRRAISFLHFALLALYRGSTLPRPDIIVGVSTPLSTAWAAHWLARRYQVPWVFEVQDLWPAFPIQMGAIPSAWLQHHLYHLEQQLYGSAAHITTLSPDMTAHVARFVPPEKITTVLNGTDFDLLDQAHSNEADLRSRYSLGTRTIILYAGTFGRANDIPTILEAARRLEHRRDLVVVFLGQGFHEPTIRNAAATRSNVVLAAPQPRHQIFHWFSAATISLNTFIDLSVLAANSPAKFYDSLGAGTPVIVTNPGWTKEFVETHRCGWYVPPEDPAALAQRLDTLLKDPKALVEAGRYGAAIARRLFDRTVLAAEMEAILERVAAAGK